MLMFLWGYSFVVITLNGFKTVFVSEFTGIITWKKSWCSVQSTEFSFSSHTVIYLVIFSYLLMFRQTNDTCLWRFSVIVGKKPPTVISSAGNKNIRLGYFIKIYLIAGWTLWKAGLISLHFLVYIDGAIKLPQVYKLFSCHWHLQSRSMYETLSQPWGTEP